MDACDSSQLCHTVFNVTGVARNFNERVNTSVTANVLRDHASIYVYDVHTEAGRGSAPCGCPHRKLEPTDIILSSSSHAKKLVFFVPEFLLWTE